MIGGVGQQVAPATCSSGGGAFEACWRNLLLNGETVKGRKYMLQRWQYTITLTKNRRLLLTIMFTLREKRHKRPAFVAHSIVQFCIPRDFDKEGSVIQRLAT